MVKDMLKSINNKNKCASVNYANEYSLLAENLTNPYCYNFGRLPRNASTSDFAKLYHIVNNDYFDKR